MIWSEYQSIAVYVLFSVGEMAWIGEHPAFFMEEYIRNGSSVIYY